MTEQNYIGIPFKSFRNDLTGFPVIVIGIEQANIVSGINQRTGNRQESQRRQMLSRQPASNRLIRNIDEKYFHRWYTPTPTGLRQTRGHFCLVFDFTSLFRS
jgi:hypothetical protein